MIFLKKEKGFTLIELLVVISIIGVLATVVLSSLGKARSQALEKKYITELNSLEWALELYYQDHNSYPNSGPWSGTSELGGSYDVSGPNAYIPGITPDYISVLPTTHSDEGYDGFLYFGGSTGYKLLLHGTEIVNSFPSEGEKFYDPRRPTWSLMVCEGPYCSL